MGYLFLFLSVLSGSVKGFFGKKISNKTASFKSAVLSNLIRMLFCIPIGFVFVLFDGGISAFSVYKEVLLIALFAGVSTSFFIATWLLAIQKSAYTAMDAFLAMGILLPITLSAIFYKESVMLSQIIGLILLFFSVLIMGAYNKQIKEKLSLASVLLLIVVSVMNGLSDFSQKIFIYSASGASASAFNFYTYVVAAAVLFILFICLKDKSPITSREERDSLELAQSESAMLDKRKLLYIAVMAFALFCCSYFKTLAASRLTAVELYSLAQGLSMLFSLLMSATLFKEKIKPLSIIGTVILFIGLLFINIIIF